MTWRSSRRWRSTSNIASFTDPTTGQVQTDISAGNVYVAWATANCCASIAGTPVAVFQSEYDLDGHFDGWRAGFQRLRRLINYQLDYGPTTERDALPAITISQGRLPGQSGQQEMPEFRVVKLLLGGAIRQRMSTSLWSTRSLLVVIFVLMEQRASSILEPRQTLRSTVQVPVNQIAASDIR